MQEDMDELKHPLGYERYRDRDVTVRRDIYDRMLGIAQEKTLTDSQREEVKEILREVMGDAPSASSTKGGHQPHMMLQSNKNVMDTSRPWVLYPWRGQVRFKLTAEEIAVLQSGERLDISERIRKSIGISDVTIYLSNCDVAMRWHDINKHKTWRNKDVSSQNVSLGTILAGDSYYIPASSLSYDESIVFKDGESPKNYKLQIDIWLKFSNKEKITPRFTSYAAYRDDNGRIRITKNFICKTLLEHDCLPLQLKSAFRKRTMQDNACELHIRMFLRTVCRRIAKKDVVAMTGAIEYTHVSCRERSRRSKSWRRLSNVISYPNGGGHAVLRSTMSLSDIDSFLKKHRCWRVPAKNSCKELYGGTARHCYLWRYSIFSEKHKYPRWRFLGVK